MATLRMSFRSRYYSGLTLALLAAGRLLSQADDATKGRSTPIIFSSPRSDTVSSNLNQMGSKSSSLRDLESGLKKPFEIFDNGRSGGVQLPNQFTPSTPPPPTMNRKMKDALDKRAEESYLLSEDDESQFGVLSPDRDTVDPITGKPKTSLDRYYDRIDRSRTGPTNQISRSLDLLAERDSSNANGDSKLRTSSSLFDSELAPNGYVSSRMSNSISDGGRLFSERSKPRNYGNAFELGPVERAQQRSRETRMDEFKRLLDGPGSGSRDGFSATPPPSSSTAYQLPKPTIAAPSASGSIGSQPAGGSYATTPGYSGSVGVPSGVREYAPSSPAVTAVPSVQQQQPPAQQPPVPSFKLPRGRF